MYNTLINQFLNSKMKFEEHRNLLKRNGRLRNLFENLLIRDNKEVFNNLLINGLKNLDKIESEVLQACFNRENDDSIFDSC